MMVPDIASRENILCFSEVPISNSSCHIRVMAGRSLIKSQADEHAGTLGIPAGTSVTVLDFSGVFRE